MRQLFDRRYAGRMRAVSCDTCYFPHIFPIPHNRPAH